MIAMISTNGDPAYGICEFTCDSPSDIPNLPTTCGMGSRCIVMSNGDVYFLNGKKQWIKPSTSTSSSSSSSNNIDLFKYATTEYVDNAINDIQHPSVDLSNYATKEEVRDTVAAIQHPSVDLSGLATKEELAAFLAQYRPIKYEITSAPKGTLIDYRDKEIRVMCPANTVFEKQNVGPTGNANMYYMGFKAYAPEGAASFKEGDKGVIVDEMFDFTGSFAGTDQYGRNYSIVWLALASYDADTDSWTYYGASSSTEKYIGWTYIVEWYDADGTIISADKIRINLSNENCHLNLAPYYGTV